MNKDLLNRLKALPDEWRKKSMKRRSMAGLRSYHLAEAAGQAMEQCARSLEDILKTYNDDIWFK